MPSPEKKLFISEIRKRRRIAERAGTPAGAADATGIDNADLLRAILDLRDEIRGSGNAMAEPAAADGEAADSLAPAAGEPGTGEVALLRNELHALSRAIQDTKAEIVALRPADQEGDKLLAVANELDAVVEATEGATETILESAERIDELAQSLRLAASDDRDKEMADEIQERAVTIFEACNFQDLTGQRITKVVNTLKYVEERVEAMIAIWGAEALAAVAPPPDTEKEGDEALLNGPQLGENGISQDEIDNMFD
jgi:chemotaxis protein CheZ